MPKKKQKKAKEYEIKYRASPNSDVTEETGTSEDAAKCVEMLLDLHGADLRPESRVLCYLRNGQGKMEIVGYVRSGEGFEKLLRDYVREGVVIQTLDLRLEVPS